MTRFAIGAAALALAACGAAPPTQIVLGPVQAEDRPTLFTRARAALVRAGYPPIEEDGYRGRFLVATHDTGTIPRFTVQLFGDGWVQVSLSGPDGALVEGAAQVGGALGREHAELAIALREALDTEPTGARAESEPATESTDAGVESERVAEPPHATEAQSEDGSDENPDARVQEME